jgi:cation transport regulator ChaC
MYRRFLTTQAPFNQYFDRRKAGDFYRNFRCGLVHEAATKGGALIHASGTPPDCIYEERTDGDTILYRDAFQGAIEQYIEWYLSQVREGGERLRNFIRKMDDICQLRRLYYFAYGSNMWSRQLSERGVRVHEKFKCVLRGFRFRYNKKSHAGTSKANIEDSFQDEVQGVCFEIDEDALPRLSEYEKGYNQKCVCVNMSQGKLVICKTFLSQSVFDEPVAPDPEYVQRILAGAKEHGLPEQYIKDVLTPS